MPSPSTHTVAGTTLTMPVQVRDARCIVAGFTADADAMARAIAAWAHRHFVHCGCARAAEW